MLELLILAALVVLAFILSDLRKTTRQSASRLDTIGRSLTEQESRISDLLAAVTRRDAAPTAPAAASEDAPEPPPVATPATAPDERITQVLHRLEDEFDAARPSIVAAERAAIERPPAPPSASAAVVAPDPEPEPAMSGADGEPPPPRRESLADLEKRFGTQWVVWVGGLALALGGIFLIRYSIEQGYLGPGPRVAVGALLALGLVGVGEWARRQELRSGAMGVATAHIPSILTAAGTTVAYATVYGAYALYGFLSPAAAFVLLGIVALATLAAALAHGPMLAGLGLVGAYVTPMLVSTAEPNYWALYVYLAVVTASAFALARIRLWRRLAVTAAVFGLVWMLPGIGDAGAVTAHAFFAVAGFALSAVFIVAGLVYGPPADDGRIDTVSSGVLAGFLFTSFLQVVATLHDPIALAVFTLLVAATAAIALRSPAAAGAVPVAAALAVLVVAHWALDYRFVYFEMRGTPGADVAFRARIAAVGAHLAAGAAFAAIIGAAAFLAQGRARHALIPVLWAASGALTPLLVMVALYWRLYEFGRALPLALVAFAVAAAFGLATGRLAARAPRAGLAAAIAIFASAGLASLALALAFALEKGWLTVGLALMAPGIALIADKRPLPMLRWAIAVTVGIVMLRVFWNPRIVGADLAGSMPIVNWLLYGYGVPAVSFWFAGHLLRRRADDLPSRMTDSAAILFTVLLFAFEIRHLIYAGDVFRQATGLAEIALNVSSFLATTIGLERTRMRTGSIVHDWGARILGTVAFAGIVVGLAVLENPMRTADPVGGLFFNLVLLGYGLPAVLMGALARTIRTTRPPQVYAVAAVTAIALALAYLTLEVRTLFHGEVLPFGPTTDAEQYAYSATWLAFGVAILIVGVLLPSQPARLASAAVVTLTAGKVFLYDLAGVQGAFRAFSFIGLGLVLMGIGWLYQRLLFPRPAADA